MEAVTYFLFLGSKITADGDYSHEIRRHLLLGRKAITDLNSVLKSRIITLLHIDGGKVETVTYFILLGFKMTVDSDCSHKIKKHLLLGRKAMTNLDSILKSRDITLPEMSI